MAMCGRYYIEIDEDELRDIAREIEKNKQNYPEQLKFKVSGEIFPTDIVPVQTGISEYQLMKWGFQNFQGRPIINARSETALERTPYKESMFRESMLYRRCLVPASGYYEWQKDGNKRTKYQLYIPNKPMYFAGCWRQEKGSPFRTFVILTRPAAAGGIEAIHDRMPVIIPQHNMRTWLYDSADVMAEAVTELSFEEVS